MFHLILLLASLLSACGEVIGSASNDDDNTPPLVVPILVSFTIDDMGTGDVLLSPSNNRDSVEIATATVAATRATLEVRLARLQPSGTLAPEVRCDVLPLTINPDTDEGASQQTLVWQTTGLPNGVYRFRVQLSNNAGNSSQTQSSVSIVRVGFAGNTRCPLAP